MAVDIQANLFVVADILVGQHHVLPAIFGDDAGHFIVKLFIQKAAIAADQSVEAVTSHDEGSEAKIQEEKLAEAEAKKAEAETEGEA